jgi:hypothetical protein
MIEMSVRQQDAFRRDFELIDRLADVRDIAARIDDGGAIWSPYRRRSSSSAGSA